MKPSFQFKPISYLKAHASELIRELGEQREALIITRNGAAKAVLRDVQSYEQTRETLALLEILALGNRLIEVDKVKVAYRHRAAAGYSTHKVQWQHARTVKDFRYRNRHEYRSTHPGQTPCSRFGWQRPLMAYLP